MRLLTQPPSKFDPIEGVDYGWVVKMAEKAHEQTLTSYRRVDDKAAAILTYLGAGTGLITLGSVSSAVVGQADFLLVLACIPSAVCGMVAMAFAAIGRRAGWVLHVPLPHHIAALAEWHDDPGAAEAEMIGKYGQCIEHNQKAVVKKAGWVNSAMWAFVVGIACLAIPVGQVLYAKSTAPTATTQK